MPSSSPRSASPSRSPPPFLTLRSLVLSLVLAGLLLPGLPAPRAAADAVAETEHRLKTAGIDEALRERIHEAIRRGVRALRARQDRHGRFRPDRPGSLDPGETALAALALRHAAIPDAMDGVEPALEQLLERRSRTVLGRTYAAGLTAMLLAADRRRPRALGALHAKLARGPQTGDGYWTYGTSSASGQTNLSTAQFGALGLWAAERAGATPDTKAWRLHLTTLLRAQELDGSWAYEPPWRNADW